MTANTDWAPGSYTIRIGKLSTKRFRDAVRWAKDHGCTFDPNTKLWTVTIEEGESGSFLWNLQEVWNSTVTKVDA